MPRLGPADPGVLEEALGAAGLPAGGPYRVLAATSGDALAEALKHLGEAARYAVGDSAAVLYEGPGADGDVTGRLRSVWPLLQACGAAVPDASAPDAGADTALRLGVGSSASGAQGLRASLGQARFALAAAGPEAPVRGVEQLDTLAELLAGVPREVRSVFGTRTLGALGEDAAGDPGGVPRQQLLLDAHGGGAAPAREHRALPDRAGGDPDGP